MTPMNKTVFSSVNLRCEYNDSNKRLFFVLLIFILFCPYAKGQTEYKLTIPYTEFGSSYDDTEYNHTSIAYSTDFNNPKEYEVEWVSKNVKGYNWMIYFKPGGIGGGGILYNKTNLGKIKKISFGGSIFICYGDTEKPYNLDHTTIEANDHFGYFRIMNESQREEAKSTISISITFEIDDTPPSITLDENSRSNSSIIESNINETVNVYLNRTLMANMWNTICLPFNLNSEQKVSLFGEGYHLQEFSSIGNDNGVTQLKFQAVAEDDDLVAGIPYIVYPTKSIAAEDTQELKGVIVSCTTPQAVTVYDDNSNAYTFQGIYIPSHLNNIKDDPKQVLLFGPNNKLYWPHTTNPLKGFHAFFTLSSPTYSVKISLSAEEQGISDSISLSDVSGIATSDDGIFPCQRYRPLSPRPIRRNFIHLTAKIPIP